MDLAFGTDLSGKVVAITGAASATGSMFAKTLAYAGAKVALLDYDVKSATRIAKTITLEGYQAKAYKTNVLDPTSLKRVQKKISSDFGPCDILVNGIRQPKPPQTALREFSILDQIEMETLSFFQFDKENAEFISDLNFIGILLPCQIFSSDMIGRHGCSILNITSMNGYRPLANVSSYSGSRAAINNFTQWLAVYFSKFNIRVNAIASGVLSTSTDFLLYNEDGTPTARSTRILQATPMGRFGESEELNGTLLFLLNQNAASFITGVVIPIDGGFSAYSRV